MKIVVLASPEDFQSFEPLNSQHIRTRSRPGNNSYACILKPGLTLKTCPKTHLKAGFIGFLNFDFFCAQIALTIQLKAN